jgi:hypothetical protein
MIRSIRAERVQQMAATLAELGTYGDEREAIRSLMGRYAPVDIMMLIDDARQAAVQQAVAREMGAP